MAKAGTGEMHPFLDRLQHALMRENLSKGDHFSHPGRVDGFDSGLIWIVTEECVLLRRCPPCLYSMRIPQAVFTRFSW